MGKDGQALMLLVGVLLVALVGIVIYVGGATRRAELASRGALDPGETGWRRLRRRLDRQLRRTRTGQRLDRWLSSAGTKIAAIDLVLGGLGLTVLAGILLRLLLPGGVALLVGAVVVAGGARVYVERLRGKRRDAFVAQLPDVARVLANGASAGLSLPAAVQLAARELPEPAAAEMRSVVEQLRVGQPVEDALESLRERLPSRELGVLMTTLVIQQRAGGDTVRALNELSGTLDARKDLLREIRTLLSGAVYTSYVVAGIGVGAIVLLNFIAPGVMREMTTTLPGLVALVVSGTLWGVAFVLIRRTTRVEV